jgi:DNA-binding transcriptional regulator YdaS (Cro superfamily)
MDNDTAAPIPAHIQLDHRLATFPGGARALAGAIGTHESVVCHWRAGRRVPGAKYRPAIEKLTGVPVAAWPPPTQFGPTMFKKPTRKQKMLRVPRKPRSVTPAHVEEE